MVLKREHLSEDWKCLCEWTPATDKAFVEFVRQKPAGAHLIKVKQEAPSPTSEDERSGLIVEPQIRPLKVEDADVETQAVQDTATSVNCEGQLTDKGPPSLPAVPQLLNDAAPGQATNHGAAAVDAPAGEQSSARAPPPCAVDEDIAETQLDLSSNKEGNAGTPVQILLEDQMLSGGMACDPTNGTPRRHLPASNEKAPKSAKRAKHGKLQGSPSPAQGGNHGQAPLPVATCLEEGLAFTDFYLDQVEKMPEESIPDDHENGLEFLAARMDDAAFTTESTSFSGIEAPHTCRRLLHHRLQQRLGRKINGPELTYAVEWDGHCQRELTHMLDVENDQKSCVFGDICGFFREELTCEGGLIPQLFKSPGMAMETLAPLLASGTLVKRWAWCHRHQKLASICSVRRRTFRQPSCVEHLGIGQIGVL